MANCGSFIVGTVLFILNLILLILSSTLIFFIARILIWQHEFKSLEELAEINFTSVATFILIVGILCAFTAILGLCGICCRNSCALKVFGFLILGLIALGIAIVVLINKDRSLADKFENNTINAIKEISKNQTKNAMVQQFQYLAHCCGFEGPQDYFHDNKTFLPVSCCGYNPRTTKNDTICTIQGGNEIPNHPVASGCKVYIANLPALFGNVFGFSIALILFELAIVMAACCLAKEYQLEESGHSNSVF